MCLIKRAGKGDHSWTRQKSKISNLRENNEMITSNLIKLAKIKRVNCN